VRSGASRSGSSALSRPALPVLHVEEGPWSQVDRRSWPATVPAVAQLLDAGLDLGPLTVLVGENGTGKSTLVEALAVAYGLSPEGGSTQANHSTRATESDLGHALQIRRGIGASRWGFFLRAETMHGFYTYLEQNPNGLEHDPRRRDPRFHEMSHGESFLAVLGARFTSPGLYVLDEPESALSFSACLGLVGLLHELASSGTSQVVVATHSPIVASVPGARIIELDGDGWHDSAWEDLQLVEHHRRFLDAPGRYLRHIVDEPT
jgi:predicted ATPase